MALIDPEEEEVAQQRHGRHHSNIRLVVEGEDRQEEDGVGMKMESMDLVMAKDGVEEVREGGTSPATMLLMKKG